MEAGRKNSKMQLKQRWLELFGGYENETEGCDFRKPDFWYLPSVVITSKKKIVMTGEKNITAYLIWDLWHQRVVVGAKSLRMNGCNYFGASTIRSAPFAIFGRQDILTLALEMDKLWKDGLKEKIPSEVINSWKDC